MNPVARWDRQVVETVRRRRTPPVVASARLVSAMAEPRIAYPVVAGAGLWASGRRRALGDVAGGAAALATVVAGMVVRRAACGQIARTRPPRDAWLVRPDGHSLPSRHTTMAALTAGVCVDLLTTDAGTRRAVPLLVAATVGASRVVLGVHWPSDVLAGWLFAQVWLRLTRPVRVASHRSRILVRARAGMG
ncbi:phosphatase PAP2 family protein [Jiangella anatolica]|uniref:Phosphatidic acid phosphatase type 2/haloperoxidase domain-containing protein n=1 Tax=Jiangella anatolica TaxID=2670374 RepID=A0A2W2C1W5_9ACTN|nr:phosphatase PAP2 family protein [Jiangella anatolica]PZF86078.1 hypothetical protein C1I92_02540 [Jiangella anatolica]